LKAGEVSLSGKTIWRLLNENGQTHIHKSAVQSSVNANSLYKRRKVVDISTVTDLEDARQLIKLGWEYKTVFPATLENAPHYVLVK
jgi:hypothetical protein